MFTGLIEAVGRIDKITTRGDYRVLTVSASFAGDSLAVGESISCDGACLTVTSHDNHSFVAEASRETIARTIVGDYRTGSPVNLERALKAGERLGGHLVTGHVDATGVVDRFARQGESWELAVAFNSRFDNLVIEKGSIAVNGVSLTVNDAGSGRLSVNIIPHTFRSTAVGRLRRGDRVNLEFDMLGKYLLKMMDNKQKGKLTIEKLRESGW
ncbi:MAG: riboflavin synthase [Candidatus Zixiibacteriota bacterium]|nr:MAG: riboflavin synthase [candidate division Zixibacteria bacterium]